MGEFPERRGHCEADTRHRTVFFQYRVDRARRTLHGVDQQLIKAANAVAGKALVKRNQFITLTGAHPSINRELEAKVKAFASWKSYATNLAGSEGAPVRQRAGATRRQPRR